LLQSSAKMVSSQKKSDNAASTITYVCSVARLAMLPKTVISLAPVQQRPGWPQLQPLKLIRMPCLRQKISWQPSGPHMIGRLWSTSSCAEGGTPECVCPLQSEFSFFPHFFLFH
jgi:hypothetical protein